ARRERREPSAYIVGVREFWSLDFAVSPAVLIPRPCTELIVEEAVALLRNADAPLVADVGTGSGCIGVSLAHAVPTPRGPAPAPPPPGAWGRGARPPPAMACGFASRPGGRRPGGA